MSHSCTMLHLLLLLPFVFSESDYRCLQCSSPGLKDNWEITSLPILPKDLPSDTLCDNAEEVTTSTWLVDCPNSVCFEMILSVGNKPMFLRGCYENFLNFSTNVTSSLNNATLRQYSTIEGQKISGTILGTFYTGPAVTAMAVYSRQIVDFAPNGDRKYLPNLFIKQDVYFKNYENKQLYSCLLCSKVGGEGSCDSGVTTTCRGTYCTKMEGFFGNDWFERRGCSPINPLSGDMCSWMNSTSSIFLLDGILSANYRATHCYCSGEHCNASPLLSSSLFTLLFSLLIMRLLPFSSLFFSSSS